MLGMGYAQDVPHSLTPITVNCQELTKDIELTSIFKVGFVPLETNERCVIQRIEKVVNSNGHWIIWDKRQNSVFSFDSGGKFINKITTDEDVAPGKFKYCYDIDAVNDTLFLLADKSILLFDLNLHYLSQLSLPKRYAKFMVQKGWAYLYANIQTSTDREKVGALCLAHPDTVFPLLNEHRDLGFFNLVEPLNFSCRAGEVLFSYLLTDTIYALNRAAVYPKYLLDFPGREFAKHAFDQMPKDPYEIAGFVNTLDKTTYVHLPNRFIANDLGVTFHIKIGSQGALFYQSATSQARFLTESCLLDGKPFNLIFAGSTADSMISSVFFNGLAPSRKEALKSQGYPIENGSNLVLVVFSAL